MEFAEWVGRTKRKKIYVISTPKRPVPLEHFLYTGDSGKTKDERFLILDSSGSFVKVGYDKAVAAKKARESKSKSQFGAGHPKQHGGGGGGGNFVNPKQEKNIWLTLVDHLSRNDKLPIVAFTLSRNRCDTNASLLTRSGHLRNFILFCIIIGWQSKSIIFHRGGHCSPLFLPGTQLVSM